MDLYPMIEQPADEPTQDSLQNDIERQRNNVELLSFCNNWFKSAAEWRRNSFEIQWARWQRNADAIFDPEVANKKEGWQSKAFVPITPSHRENAQAQLFKTEVGPRPPLDVKARKGIPLDMDQSDNIRDLILREREKSRYEIERNKVLEDKTTYGDGFARVRFEEIIEDRVIKVPDLEPINVFDPTSIGRAVTGQRRVIGYHDEVQPVMVYRGIRFEHLSIWDIFPDPKALRIKGNPIAYRYEMTYGDVVKGVQEGYYLPEAIEKLKADESGEQTPIDKKLVQADREISDSVTKRPDYAKRIECKEFYARLPKKWVLIKGEPIDDPEKLIPARIIFTEACLLAVEVNDAYDGEAPIYKDGYIPVAGQFYCRGIPEMLKDVQLVANEEVNQRLDCKALTLNPMFAVIEKAIRDPKELVSKTGGVIRLNANAFNGAPFHVQDALQRIDMGSLDRAAFIEPQEWERWAQERTSINRQTLGTAGQVKDANQTLGGMEILRAASGDKLAYIGMLSEFDFQYEVTRAFWKLIYQNYGPEDVALAIGPERAATFIPMSPEQVENSYQYYPMGVYTMENKAMRQARLAQIDAQFAMEPYFNRLEILRAELQGADEDPDRFVVPEADAVQIMVKAQQMANGMADQMMAQKVANGPGSQNSTGKEDQGNAPKPGVA